MNKYDYPDSQSEFAFPIAKAGYPIIFAMGFLTLVLALLGFAIPALAGLAVTFFCCWFFRAPDRVVQVKHWTAVVFQMAHASR